MGCSCTTGMPNLPPLGRRAAGWRLAERLAKLRIRTPENDAGPDIPDGGNDDPTQTCCDGNEYRNTQYISGDDERIGNTGGQPYIGETLGQLAAPHCQPINYQEPQTDCAEAHPAIRV